MESETIERRHHRHRKLLGVRNGRGHAENGVFVWEVVANRSGCTGGALRDVDQSDSIEAEFVDCDDRCGGNLGSTLVVVHYFSPLGDNI